MTTLRRVALVALAPLALTLFAGCEAEDPTQGDEQNQTESSWTLDDLVDGPDPMDVGGHSRIAVTTASDGSVVVAYQDASRHLAIGARAASGEWKHEVVKADSECGAYASIAFAGDGSLHVVHYDRAAGGLVDSTRAPGATAWTHTPIAPGAGESEMARAADGSLHLALLRFNETTRFDDLVYARLADGKWTLEPLGNGSYFNSPAIGLDDAGRPQIVAYQWHDESLDTGNLVLADKTSGSWKSEALDLPTSYATDVLVEGNVTHLVYPAPDEKGLFHVSRSAGGAWSTPETIASYGGWDPDLERDASGQLHVVFTVDGRARYASQGADGKWTGSRIAQGAGGHIEPRFVPGKDREVVFTDWAYKDYYHARFDAK